MQEMQVWSLGWEDPMEKELATRSSILASKLPWTEEPGGIQSRRLTKSGIRLSDWAHAQHINSISHVDTRDSNNLEHTEGNTIWQNMKKWWVFIIHCVCSSLLFNYYHVQLFATPWPQHTRLPCPSVSPGVCSNSCPLSWWCHPTISSSVVPFSSCLQSFPISRSFPMSRLFLSGGQSIRASASTSVLPVNIQDWFPLGWTDLISLQSKGFSRVFSNTTVQKLQFSGAQLSLWSNSHIHTWLLEQP